jgi:hypothetical protein
VRDRRGSPRYRCNLRCELQRGRKKHPAVLLDVSRSGLSVQIDHELAQGDEVELLVDRDVRIRALAWRTRPTRAGFTVGMMLSEVSAPYEALIGRYEARSRPPVRSAQQPPPAEPAKPAAPAVPESECWWRMRVKETDGPRTRTVMLAAHSRSAAIAKAVEEMGRGWEVIEAQARRMDEPKRP